MGNGFAGRVGGGDAMENGLAAYDVRTDTGDGSERAPHQSIGVW